MEGEGVTSAGLWFQFHLATKEDTGDLEDGSRPVSVDKITLQ